MKSNDLGTLQVQRLSPLTLGAPSRWTRGVWLLGVGACIVFLGSVALTFGWFEANRGLELGRSPSGFETVFWLVPLVLAGFCLGMALGGVRLTFLEEGVLCRSLWPARRRSLYLWGELHYARFWEEQTRSRERLYGARFVFKRGEITLRLAQPSVWQGLREQFTS